MKVTFDGHGLNDAEDEYRSRLLTLAPGLKDDRNWKRGDEIGRFAERAINTHPALLAALEEIAKGEGAYSRDPLKHAENTIESMKEIARSAIAAARKEG